MILKTTTHLLTLFALISASPALAQDLTSKTEPSAVSLSKELDSSRPIRIDRERFKDWLSKPVFAASGSTAKIFIQKSPASRGKGIRRVGNTERIKLTVQLPSHRLAAPVNPKGKSILPRDTLELIDPSMKSSLVLKRVPSKLPGIKIPALDIDVFSGSVSASTQDIVQLAKEVNAIKDRRFVEFKEGTREIKRIGTIPHFDLKGFLRGKRVEMPRFDLIKPLESLGSSGISIDHQKSLMITSLPVLEDSQRTMNPCKKAEQNDPLKVWTFGHLMTEMAQGSGMTPAQFTENWLQHWRAPQTVFDSTGSVLLDETSATAQAKIDNLVINPWRARSGGGDLDLRIAPFRLNAIIYRPDLAVSNAYTGQQENNGGELRFVFGMMNVRDNNGDGDALDGADTCQPLESAVIFEYGVPLNSCSAIKEWANRWVDLSEMLPGTPTYANALEALTQEVVLHGANPDKPNQNAINQIRTNEISLTEAWQFREFVLSEDTGALQQTTTKNNPREHFFPFTATPNTPTPINLNGSDLLRDLILNNLMPILNGTFEFPETVGGLPFIGGSSSYDINTAWNHPDFTEASHKEARFKFSLNTCSGCHTSETGTFFYHVRPMGPGNPPGLSEFLTQSPWVISDVNSIPREFSEMEFRKQHLSSLANQSCLFRKPPLQILRVPLVNPH